MTTTIVVGQPMCTPIRGKVATALSPYHFGTLMIDSYAINAQQERGKDGATLVGGQIVVRNIAEVTISAAAAEWCEYLLLRTGQFELWSEPINPKNIAWAAQWDGQMPRPWIDASCKGWLELRKLSCTSHARLTARQGINVRRATREKRARSGLPALLRAWYHFLAEG